MDTIKERFEKEFGTFPEMASKHSVLIFFHQELEALASEVEAETIIKPVTDFEAGDNAGMKYAATFIRNRAAALK